MEEKTVTMMEGVAREWRVRVQDAAGNVLDPAGFSFYGGAADGMQVPRRMQVRVEGDVVVLVLPGLWMSGRCWRYQVLCQDVLTGVEWVLCQGDVVLERRVACNGPALHEDAVLVDAVLDSEQDQVEVYLGDSTAATAEAARLAVAARAGAEAAAERVAADVVQVEDLKRVVLDVAEAAALAAERAEDSKHGAEAAAGDAAADAQVAEGKAAEAEASREAAEAAQRQAAARAAEADASAKVATEAVSDALAARDEAVAAQRGAEAAQVVAEDASAQAGRYAAQAVGAADGAVVAQGAAEAARAEAEAAQSGAAEQAAIATAAAEAAQAPESIAAQAARPATMVLLKDELLALLGDASLFDVDTDGRRIIVHTDRLADDQLAAVEDMLGRFVPQFIEVEQLNHSMEISWQEAFYKYAQCVTTSDMLAVNANYKNDLTSDGEWPYLLPLYNDKADYNNLNGRALFEGSSMRKIEKEFASLKDGYRVFWKCQQLLTAKVSLPVATSISALMGGCRVLESVEIYAPNATTAANGCLGHRHNPCPLLRDIKIFAPKLSNADWFTDSGQMSKESMLGIVAALPTWSSGSHPITLGVHVDYLDDPEVLAAKADAEAKGWTVNLQFNPQPSATTYSLRSKLIYAKLSVLDGKQEIAWGHYVTNWEERGYEQFRSVEAAREYFGLPEEDLTETE